MTKIIRLFKTVKCAEEKNPFFSGAINALWIVIPFWLVVAWLVWG